MAHMKQDMKGYLIKYDAGMPMCDFLCHVVSLICIRPIMNGTGQLHWWKVI